MNNIDWHNIRAVNGSQSDGFEELCAQLARAESPEESGFNRKGSPDAGVECYYVDPDGNEWGWQAKYFTSSLTNSQWRQLDDSVTTALDKHPRLVRYYVCVPRDRSDARNPNQTSEMDRWNAHTSKWEGWAREKGMTVEFVWWGSSELIERLSRNEHIGRHFFWFGQRGFDQDWFQLRLNEAIEAAGPRYVREIHVELPIALQIERFSRSAILFDEIKSLATGIRRSHGGLASARRSLAQPVEETNLDHMSKAVSMVLGALSQLGPSPIGVVPFPAISEAAQKGVTAGNKALEQFWELQRKQKKPNQEERTSPSYRGDPLRDILYYIQNLQMKFQDVVETCNRADSMANGQLLLLKGDGGTGKTHLLCDFSKGRVEAQLPTVLLMGQRFLSDDEPWTQILQQLDMAGTSAEQFMGALEAAAQASDCRALLIIDALNEGNGRKIWPAHLSAFLERAEKSPWIGVVISVRSPYEEFVIPEDVRERAVSVVHDGFSGHEYNAVETFFTHYGLEFPSTPILQPEFRNPLFLKTLCKGLQASGERRIPRGFHGVTAVFNLYLKRINARLAKPQALDYDSKDNLVQQGLERVAVRLMEQDTRWLDRTEAQGVVDSLLPGRDYSKSLYAALVSEGLLIEDMGWSAENPPEEVVFVSYERFADHVIANHLLRLHIDTNDPKAVFSEGGGLAFLLEEGKYVPHGLIEALCIQIPERTGKELVRLAAGFLKHPTIGEAYLGSIRWRRLDAFSEDTRTVLRELNKCGKMSFADPLDTLLSVSTVPGHPFNADFLDQRLRQDDMPDRDSWWSTYLHRAWGNETSVDRLVSWASALTAGDYVEVEVVDLAATVLAWMFSTPNRFLRDRATKALVNLLTGRLESAERLVDRFNDVDDPYVAERVYAVTYGVAMRSHDAGGVGKLAVSVYKHVFASGIPRPHILLRDYARSVIERAIYLGAEVPICSNSIRPPYHSSMPDIPDEDAVESLASSRGSKACDDGDSERARWLIYHSVMGELLGDFARYVMGSESGSNWLNLTLDEDPWQSPQERMAALLEELSQTELVAYEEFKKVENDTSTFLGSSQSLHQHVHSDVDVEDALAALFNAGEAHKLRIETARRKLMPGLTEGHRNELESILRAKSEGPPRFDVRAIQRYVLWRVFNLGWTEERFGHFDSFTIRFSGREANKPERMGKKYQWIAYHEILACIADHYQYREGYYDENAKRRYEGPWQESLRDMDPYCTLSSTQGGTSWGPHEHAWWAKEQYYGWNEESSHQDWLADFEGLPKIKDLLEVENAGTRWLNVAGSFVWRQPHPADQEPFDHARRQLWIELTGYFVRTEEAETFLSWAKTVDFWGRWMPEAPETYSADIYSGEHGWAPAFDHMLSNWSNSNDWSKPESPDGKECPVEIRPVFFRYAAEPGGFDCSIEEGFVLRLPHHEFIRHMDLQPSTNGVEYADSDGNVVSFDPTVHEPGPTALLLNKEHLEKYLQERRLSLCWVMLGEKQVIGGDATHKFQGHLKMSGAYQLTEDGPKGFVNYNLNLPSDPAPGS